MSVNRDREKKKLYIFFTASIASVGGMQQYVRGKIESLKELGWEILVFSPQSCIGTSVYKDLDDYMCGGNKAFAFLIDEFSEQERQRIYEMSLKSVSVNPNNYEKICIESHFESVGFWAEYFASKMKAKHYFCAINELFRGENKYYEKYMDFFNFKLKRSEITGRVQKLFEGYIDIKETKEYESWVREKYPIEEVACSKIDKLKPLEYNIALISRGAKEYVSSAINAIYEFCIKHPNDEILVTFVGDFECRYEEIDMCFSKLANVETFYTGVMIPIPKSLFRKIDVVLANSDTAFYSAYENIPVIVLSHEYGLCNGVLGYDCAYDESIYLKGRKPHNRITTKLEDVLVKKIYEKQSPQLPILEDANTFNERKIELFEINVPTSYKDYYHFYEQSDTVRSFDWIKNTANKYDYQLLKAFDLNKKDIVIFGAGEEGKMCLNWLISIGKNVLYFVDNDVKKQGEEISGYNIFSPEKLIDSNSDLLIIVANLNNYKEIQRQLINDYKLSRDICVPYRYIENWPMISIFYE